MVRLIRAPFVFLLVTFAAPSFGSISELGTGDVRFAYLDPGAGSFMIQALVAALAGVAVTLRLYWTRIRSLLGLATADDDDDRDDDNESMTDG